MLLSIFRGMANNPAVLDAYLKFSGALKEGKLDARTLFTSYFNHVNQTEVDLPKVPMEVG